MPSDAAAAYRDYVLCTRLYHCLPTALDEEDAATTDLHWEMYQAEIKHDQDARKE